MTIMKTNYEEETIMNWTGVKGVLSTVGGVAKKTCVVVGPILGAALFNERTVKKLFEEFRYSGKVGYDDAVSVILRSSMYSSDKVKASNILKVGEDSTYYKAAIAIVRSSAYSGDKLEMLENLKASSGEES